MNTRFHFAGALTIAIALCPVTAIAAQEAALRVVVLPFEAQAGVTEADAAAISELVRSAIAVTNEFALIEDQASKAILDESGFGDGGVGMDEASRLLADRLDAAYALSGAMSAQDEVIRLSVRLVDAATARVIFVHQESSSTEHIHRDARLFAEGIANEVVAMTAGATADNIQRLLALGRLDEASIKLDAARMRASSGTESTRATLDALGLQLGAALADRSYRASRSAVARAAKSEKDPEARDEFMVSARETGNDALFLVPDGQSWARQRERYLTFMRDSVMSYFAAEDRSRRAAIASRAVELVKLGDPDSALELIGDYVEIAGERAIDKEIKEALDKAKRARADRLFGSAMTAVASGDYSMAERLFQDASSAGIDPARFASERSRMEAIQRRDAEAAVKAERLGSSAWDPAARRPWSISTGIDLAIIDTPTVSWPLGGIVPQVRLSGAHTERVSGPILFDWRLAVRAGNSEWEGDLDIGEASVSFWKSDVSASGGFTVAFKKLDISAGAAAIAGAAKFHGELDAYGTYELIDDTFAVYLGAAIRAGIRYKFNKKLGAGIDLERSAVWSPGAGVNSGFAFGFLTELTL
jgi:TolB-like protein